MPLLHPVIRTTAMTDAPFAAAMLRPPESTVVDVDPAVALPCDIRTISSVTVSPSECLQGGELLVRSDQWHQRVAAVGEAVAGPSDRPPVGPKVRVVKLFP